MQKGDVGLYQSVGLIPPAYEGWLEIGLHSIIQFVIQRAIKIRSKILITKGLREKERDFATYYERSDPIGVLRIDTLEGNVNAGGLSERRFEGVPPRLSRCCSGTLLVSSLDEYLRAKRCAYSQGLDLYIPGQCDLRCDRPGTRTQRIRFRDARLLFIDGGLFINVVLFTQKKE